MISIIVPVFNASKYIENCIESVLNQTYSFFELILINDGSTDNSLDICKKYSTNEPRIKIINKQNEGVSPSRNIGIEKSRGKWIMFLDADDWLEPSCLSSCIRKVNEKDVDLLCFNHYCNNNTYQWKMDSLTDSTLSSKNDGLKHLKMDMMYPYYDLIENNVQVGSIRAVWGKLFKSKIIKTYKILFDNKLKISEDAFFCLDFLNHAKKVELFNNYLMHYRTHESSSMHSYNTNINEINETVLKSFCSRFQENFNEKEYQICYTGNALECLFRALRLKIIHNKNKASFKTKLAEISNLLQNPNYKKAFAFNEFKYFPIGKRELLFCSQKGSPLGVYFVAQLSIIFLSIQIYCKKFTNRF